MSLPRSSRLAVAAALAFVGVSAHAQSSVSLYGLVDMSVGRTQAPGGKAVNAADSGKMTTSYWGMGGKEDLGGGVSAVFKLESFVRVTTGATGRFDGDPLFSRSASVGLSSNSLGTVTFGRNTTALFVSTLMFNALGDSFGYSPSIRHYFTSGTTTGDTGWSDSVVYASPSIGGFRFGASAAFKTTDAATDGRNVGVNLGYSAGPLSAALVYQDVKKDGASSAIDNTRTVQAGAAYDLGVAKLYTQLGTVDNKSKDTGYDIVGFGARVPVGKGAVVAQLGRLSPDAGADRTTFSTGYLHNLSKRTELYGVLMSDKLDGVGTGKNFSVGIRHRF